MASQTALEAAIRAGQAAMENLIAQQKQAAIDEQDELMTANVRQQERLAKSWSTANSTNTPVGTVHSLVIGTLSRSDATKRERLNNSFRNIVEVEKTLDDCREEVSKARAKLLSSCYHHGSKNPGRRLSPPWRVYGGSWSLQTIKTRMLKRGNSSSKLPVGKTKMCSQVPNLDD